MAHAVNEETFAASFGHKVFANGNAIAKKADFLWRILAVIFEWRERHTDQEITRWVARSSGSLTDQIERDMMRRPDHW